MPIKINKKKSHQPILITTLFKKCKYLFCLGVISVCIPIYSSAQTIRLNSEMENLEFKDRNSFKGFSQILFPISDDSLPFYSVKSVKQIVTKKSFSLRFLSPEIITRYNSNTPFGWNDGAMIPNKGLQSLTSAGIYLKTKHFAVQLRPEILLTQNLQFQTFPGSYNDRLWSVRYFFYNETDLPEKFSRVRSFYPGQSNIKFSFRFVSTGISTENRWWGPGKNNSILMSNSSPGFAHFFVQSEKPIKTKIGSFEFQFIAGNLIGSGEYPPDTNRTYNNVRLYSPKPENANRYINGVAVTYQPVFVKGLYLGFGRVFYLYETDRRNTIDGLIPVFGALLKNETNDEDQKKRDQLFSVFVKQNFDNGNSDVYLEFGRNDHSWNLRDFISDPFHSRAYIIGVNKMYQLHKRKLAINIEVSDISRSAKTNIRITPYWYTHNMVVHGYTNYGQIIGAGIGPGSAMQSITADFIKTPLNTFGFYVYRIERNKDFFYDAFLSTGEYYRKWVDLVLGLKLNRSFKYFNLSSNINFIRSYNYEWQYNPTSQNGPLKDGVDILNLSANISLQYKL